MRTAKTKKNVMFEEKENYKYLENLETEPRKKKRR